MLFNSNEFLLFFLPAALLGFYFARQQFGKHAAFAVLLVFSLFFYGWWDWRYLPLLLGSLVVNFLLANGLQQRPSKKLLTLGIVFNLGLIAVFKYLGFIELNLELLTGSQIDWPQFILPIGISFYTFQQIAFLVDTWQSAAQQAAAGHLSAPVDPVRYGLFVCFFPQLIAGPIVHHHEMMGQFEAPPKNSEMLRMAAMGLSIFALGLAKKTLLADPLGAFASPFFERGAETGSIHFFIAWSAALAYTLQIYFDFCGYSEMALGLALMFGVKLPTNFNSPYKSRSVIDFWRRWHMTLSRFLRDYLYLPLGGNRSGPWRRYVNLMIVMLVGGLWHGAAWTFVLWGGLHGAYLMINHGWRMVQRQAVIKKVKLLAILSRLINYAAWPLTLLAVVFAWVTFRADNIDVAMQFYRAMLGLDGLSLPAEAAPVLDLLNLQDKVHLFAENSRKEFYIGMIWTALAALIALFTPSTLQLLKNDRPTADFDSIATTLPAKPAVLPAVAILRRWAAIPVGILLFLALRTINAASETEFLYFQF